MNRLTVHPDGKSPVALTMADHLATGGEGAVYLKGDTAYKVYLDPVAAASAGVEQKVALLAAIHHPGIVSPKGALRDKNGAFIGLYMQRADGEALCRAFTSAWRVSNGVENSHTVKLTDAMREIVVAAHAHQAVMVDANEMNWLVHQRTQPLVIDVDSWILAGHRPRAIMASIRDYQRTDFSQDTDWFAWAVVTFQLWTGIHPYKGVHPDFARGGMELRMRARASVFDAKVRVPAAARPVTAIPSRLREWFEDVFQGDLRTPPPPASASALGTQVVPKLALHQSSAGTVRLERYAGTDGPIRFVAAGLAIFSDKGQLGVYDLARRTPLAQMSAGDVAGLAEGSVATIQTDDGRLVVRCAGDRVEAHCLAGSEVPGSIGLRTNELWCAADRVFALVDGVSDGLVELYLRAGPDRTRIAVSHQWPVSVLSTRFYRGVLVQDCLGTPFLGIPAGDGLVLASAPALKDYRVTDGFATDPQNVWLAAVRLADGDRVALRCAGGMAGFRIEEEILVDGVEINAASTSSGITAALVNGNLHVSKGLNRRVISGPVLDERLRLIQLPNGIGGFSGSELAKISLS